MGRREDKNAMVKRQLLVAAAALFAEKGYEATSVEDITEQADFSKGTFYYHFESKDELVIELRHHLLEGTVDQAVELFNAGASPLEALEKLLLDRAAFTATHPELSSIFLTLRIQKFLFKEEESVLRPAEPDKPKRMFKKIIYQFICEAQKLGQIRADLSPLELTSMVTAFFLHVQGAWLASDRKSSLVEKAHRWVHVLLDGIADSTYEKKIPCYKPNAQVSNLGVVFPPEHRGVPKAH